MTVLEKAEKAIDFLKNPDNLNKSHEVQDYAWVLGQCMGALGGHPSMVAQFSALLQQAIPALLALCSHDSAEIRLVGDEALNRTVVGGMPFHASKVHLHLHNNIVADKNPRWLRAALSRICLGRGWLRAGNGRGRLFAQNTLPKLRDIARRVHEAGSTGPDQVLLVECLETNLPRIMKALAPYSTRDEMFALLTSFLLLTDSSSAPIRRSVASCIGDLCQYHQKKFIQHVVTTAIDALMQESIGQSSILGWFGTLRTMFNNNPISGLPRNVLTPERSMQIYHVCLHHIESNIIDHNIQNAAMECLNIVLSEPSAGFKDALLDANGAVGLNTGNKDKFTKGHCRSHSSVSMVHSTMSTASSTINLSDDILLSEHSDSLAFHGALSFGNMSQQQTPFRSMEDLSIKGINTPDSPSESVMSDINSEMMTSEQLSKYVTSKFDAAPEYKDADNGEMVQSMAEDSQYDAQPKNSHSYKLNIGTFQDADIPLKYCARLLASRFLLAGCSGKLISDRSVRVSVKACAISCLSSIVNIYPDILTMFLDKDGEVHTHNNSGNSDFSNMSNNEQLNDFVLERNVCYQESMTDSFGQELLSKSIDLMSQASGAGSNNSVASHRQSAAHKREKFKAVQESMDNSSSLAGIPSNMLDSKQTSIVQNTNPNQMGASFMSGDSCNFAMTASNFTMGSNMTASNDPLSTDFLMTTSIDPLTSSLDLEMKFDHFGESSNSLECPISNTDLENADITQINLEQRMQEVFLKNDIRAERQISNESKSSQGSRDDSDDVKLAIKPMTVRKVSTEKLPVTEKVLQTVDEDSRTDEDTDRSESNIKDNIPNHVSQNKAEFADAVESNESVFVHQHLSEIVILLEGHSDPQIRGLIRVCIGNYLSSAVHVSSGCYVKWKPFGLLPKVFADKMKVENLITIIMKGLSDEIHSCVNNSLLAIGRCIEPLSLSYHNNIIASVLNSLRCVENNAYWLCKVNLCKLYQKLPFQRLSIILSDWCTRSLLIFEIVVKLLGDQDQRVRRAATEAISTFSPTIFQPSSCDINELFVNLANSHSEKLLFSRLRADTDVLSDFKQSFVLSDLPGPFKDLTEESRSKTTPSAPRETTLVHNLKIIISTLSFKMMESNCKYFQQGCMETLLELSLQYYPTKYPEVYSGLGLLELSLQLLEYRTLPVTCVETLMAFLTQIYAIEAWNTLCSNPDENKFDFTPSLRQESNAVSTKLWTQFGNEAFSAKAETYFRITLKFMNIIIHVIEDATPIVFPQKISSMIPASPIRRKTTENSTKRYNNINNQGEVQLPDNKGALRKTNQYNSISGHFIPLGYFANETVFLKLYANIKAAYSSHKVNLDSATSVFLKFVSTILNSIAIQLEMMTEKEAGNVAEEVLYYLKCILPIKPDDSVHCITQILKCLSSINMTAHRNDLKKFFSMSENKENKDNWQAKEKYKETHLSFYSDVVMANDANNPIMDAFDCEDKFGSMKSVLSDSVWSTRSYMKDIRLQAERDCYVNVREFAKCKVDRKWSTNKQDLAKYLRLIEPVVIQALKSYTQNNIISLQCRVLELLNQLLALRVNYCLLDSGQVFIGFVHKQLENIEHHEILDCGELVRCIFTFLVHLSSAKHHSKQLMDIPKLIQLCDGLMASGAHRECVESLHPLAYRLFVCGRQEAQVTREVLFAMLQKMMHDSKVIKLVSSILIFSEEHPDGHFRWSQLACDTVLQLLRQKCVDINSTESFICLEKLFDCIHREVLFEQGRIETVLKIMFDKPPEQDTANIEIKERWLATILLFLRKVISHYAENEILLSLNYLKAAHISPMAIFFNMQNEIDPLNVQTVNENCANLSPDVIFVRFLFRVITYALLDLESNSNVDTKENEGEVKRVNKSNAFWCGLTTSLICQTKQILYLRDGCKFPLLAKTAQGVLQNEQSGLNTGLYCPEENIPLEKLAVVCNKLSWSQPLLTVHWCHLLVRLKFLEHKYWASLFGFLQNSFMHMETNLNRNMNNEVLQIGSFLTLCEHFSDNGLEEVIYLTWLLVNRIHLLVRFYGEDIVKELVERVNDNQSASGLLLQAIAARCQPFIKGTFGVKVFKILSNCHSSQSGSLVLFICRVIGSLNPSLSYSFARLALTRCRYLVSLSAEEVSTQLTKEDLQIALEMLQRDFVHTRHPSLISELNILASTFFDLSPLDLSLDRPINAQYIKTTSVDTGWLVKQIKHRCYQNTSESQTFGRYASIAKLLSNLNLEQLNSIVNCQEFDRQILRQTLRLGTESYVKKLVDKISEWEIEEVEKRNEKIKAMLAKREESLQKEVGNHDSNILNIANTFVRFKKNEPQSQFFVPIREPTEENNQNDVNSSPSKFGKLKIELRDEKSEIEIPELNSLLSVSLSGLERSVQAIVALFPRQSRPLSQFDTGTFGGNHTMDKYTRRCFQVFRDKLFHQELINIQGIVTSYLESMRNLEIVLKNMDSDVGEKVTSLFLPKNLAKALMSFTVISLQYTSYLIKSNENYVPSESETSFRGNSCKNGDSSIEYTLDVCIVNASRSLSLRPVWEELNAEKNTTRVQSAINCLYAYLRYSVKDTLPIILGNQASGGSLQDCSELASTCDKFLTLIQYWESNIYNRLIPTNCNIMSSKMQEAVEKLLVTLCRCDFASSFTLIPPLAWGCLDIFEEVTKPSICDLVNDNESNLKLPAVLEKKLKKQIVIPISSLLDMDVLEQFLFRVNFIGWTNKKSFEEIWVSLLGALQGNGTHWAIRGMMQLLLSTNLHSCTRGFTVSNSSIQRLKSVALDCKLYEKLFCDINLESIPFSYHVYSQPSLEFLRHAAGLNENPDVKVQIALKHSRKFLQSTGIDINSCLQLLMDIARQMSPLSGWGLGARSALLHCMVSVSSCFTCAAHWQWLEEHLGSLGPLRISQPQEILTQQYLVHVSCLQDTETPDIAVLTSSLSSTFAPTRTAALSSAMRQLSGEREPVFMDKESPSQMAKLSYESQLEAHLITVIQPHLVPQARVSLYEQSLCWSALFVLVDCGHDDLLKEAADFLLANRNHFCFDLIMTGVCRAIISGKAVLGNAMKTSVLKAINSQPEICFKMLPLVLCQFYTGDPLSSSGALEPEQLLANLQTSATFQTASTISSLPHSRLICQGLSSLLHHFLPPAAIINKVTQEFLDCCRYADSCGFDRNVAVAKVGVGSHLMPCYTELMAEISFKVFETSIEQNQLPILSGWLFDVLGHLLQGKISQSLTPFCLLCLIACSSNNPSIRNMSPAIFNILRSGFIVNQPDDKTVSRASSLDSAVSLPRMDKKSIRKLSFADRRLLCLGAVHSGFTKVQIDKLKALCLGNEALDDLLACLEA